MIFLKRQRVRKRKKFLGRFVRIAEKFLLSVFIFSIFFSIIFLLYYATTDSSFFVVNEIKIDGQFQRVQREHVLRESKVKTGDQLFWIDVGKVQRDLLRNPWLKRVTVRRSLPNSISITCEEHVARAILSGKELKYLDAKGDIVKVLDEGDDSDLPIISGIDKKDDILQSLDLIQRFQRSKMGSEVGLSEVNRDEDDNFSLVTQRHGVLLFLGRDGVLEKLDDFSAFFEIASMDRSDLKYMISTGRGKVVAGYRGL